MKRFWMIGFADERPRGLEQYTSLESAKAAALERVNQTTGPIVVFEAVGVYRCGEPFWDSFEAA